jgi:glycosyltransferase involved in cell wall biosynthesis
MFSTELINILKTLSSEVFVITGNFFPTGFPSNVKLVNVDSPTIETPIETLMSKIHRFLIAQFRISKEVARISTEIDAAFLFLSSSLIFLPTILLRIYRKRLLVIVTGSGSQSIRMMYPTLAGKVFSMVFRLIEHFNYAVADRIVVYSAKMAKAMELDKHMGKVFTDGYRGFIDTKHFRIKRKLEERGSVVGFIGRLSAEKGILEFVKAIPLVLSKKETRFVIIGEGVLLEDIRNFLRENGCLDRVNFIGWSPNFKIPAYLNEIKLLVLPSHTEGLPKTILEAMACGAIVLATPVGAVPDVVYEGETGFLLENNSSTHIANKITEVLDWENLGAIQRRARSLIEERFTYERAVDRYRVILGINDD